jgi:hypothetical protein
MAASPAAWGVRAAPEWALCGPKGEVDPRCEWRQVGAAADLIVQGKPLATPGLVKRIMPTQRESGTGRPLGALAAQRLWAGHVLQPDGLAHDAGFAENLIHAGQSLTREMLTLVALAAGGQHGKVAGRAAATGLPEPDEHYGHAAPAPQGAIETKTLKSAPCGTRSECCSGNSVERECGSPADRALLAGLHRLPRQTLLRLRLMVRPDAISRRHRDLLRRGHAPASRPKRPGRPRTMRSTEPWSCAWPQTTPAGDTAAPTANSSSSD